MNEVEPNIPCSHENLNPDNSSKKAKFKNSFNFQILRWTRFLMIPLTFLYDEYINRPKLTEQEKPILVYSSSPPQVGSEQK